MKNKWWRPTKFNEDTVRKLTDAFRRSATTEEACSYAGITKETFYQRYKKKNGFSDEIDSAKRFPFMLAKTKIFDAISSKDINVSAKYALEFLRRRDPEWKDKQENVVNAVGFTSITITDATTKKPGSSTNGKTEGTTE